MSPHRPTPTAASRRGFTLLEALLVLAIVIVIAGLGIPALQLMLTRSKLQGSAREISIQLGSARVAAMRLGRNVVVRPDYEAQTLVSFVDEDGDLSADLNEEELAALPIPGAGGPRGVHLMGPNGVGGTADDPAESVEGLTQVGGANLRVAVFLPDGSIRDTGGLRISDGKDQANVFEVRIEPAATARVEVLKFVYDDVSGLNPHAGPAGSWFPQGGNNWPWY